MSTSIVIEGSEISLLPYVGRVILDPSATGTDDTSSAFQALGSSSFRGGTVITADRSETPNIQGNFSFAGVYNSSDYYKNGAHYLYYGTNNTWTISTVLGQTTGDRFESLVAGYANDPTLGWDMQSIGGNQYNYVGRGTYSGGFYMTASGTPAKFENGPYFNWRGDLVMPAGTKITTSDYAQILTLGTTGGSHIDAICDFNVQGMLWANVYRGGSWASAGPFTIDMNGYSVNFNNGIGTVASIDTSGNFSGNAGSANYATYAGDASSLGGYGAGSFLMYESDPIFSSWISYPPGVSYWPNDAGYISWEVDPIFSGWLSGVPSLSSFNNDVPFASASSANNWSNGGGTAVQNFYDGIVSWYNNKYFWTYGSDNPSYLWMISNVIHFHPQDYPFVFDGSFGMYSADGNSSVGSISVSGTDIVINPSTGPGKVILQQKVNMPNLPTSSAGLASGDLWIDTTGGLNILKVV